MNKSLCFRSHLTTIAVVALAATACGGSTSAKSDGPVRTSLYERLGERKGIAAAVDAIVDALMEDPEIAGFFARNAEPDARPNLVQIKECFVLQIAAAAGGPETYPAEVSGGFTCRDMATAHAGLGIPGGVFDRFVDIAAGTLAELGVADDDIATLGGVLISTKTDIAAH